jgi:hypothetical protein
MDERRIAKELLSVSRMLLSKGNALSDYSEDAKQFSRDHGRMLKNEVGSVGGQNWRIKFKVLGDDTIEIYAESDYQLNRYDWATLKADITLEWYKGYVVTSVNLETSDAPNESQSKNEDFRQSDSPKKVSKWVGDALQELFDDFEQYLAELSGP